MHCDSACDDKAGKIMHHTVLDYKLTYVAIQKIAVRFVERKEDTYVLSKQTLCR